MEFRKKASSYETLVGLEWILISRSFFEGLWNLIIYSIYERKVVCESYCYSKRLFQNEFWNWANRTFWIARRDVQERNLSVRRYAAPVQAAEQGERGVLIPPNGMRCMSRWCIQTWLITLLEIPSCLTKWISRNPTRNYYFVRWNVLHITEILNSVKQVIWKHNVTFFGAFARIRTFIFVIGASDVRFPGVKRPFCGRGVWLSDDVITEDSLSSFNDGNQRVSYWEEIKNYSCSCVNLLNFSDTNEKDNSWPIFL
jgi:hypothetical protein